MFFMNEKIH